MTWHTVAVPRDDLHLLVLAIAGGGGTITHSRCEGDQVAVTYVV